MRRSMLRRLLWLVAGVGCYLVGMLVFLVVALDVFMAPPENSFENLSAEQLPFLAVAIVLLAVGSYINYRSGFGIGTRAFGQGPGPGPGGPNEQSRTESVLKQHGYRVPPEESNESPAAGTNRIRCSECGAENEREYSYCSNCSAELSG